MDEPWCDVDLPAVLARASQPVFLLNDRGALVFANPALHELFGVPLGNRVGWRELEAGPLKPPADLPAGGARQLDVQTPGGRWVQVVFHSLQDVHAGALGVLGVVGPAENSPTAPVSDANLFARWERLREDQRRRFGFDVCPARSEAGARLLHQLGIVATTDAPVLFLGEPGVGKLTLAKVLHHQTKDRGWSATLDAEVLGPEQQHDLLLGDAGVLLQEGPGRLIVRRSSLVSMDVQRVLVDAHESSGRRWRLLATDRDPLEGALADGRLTAGFYYLASRFTIPVPPLRERQADVADFAALLLGRRRAERGGPVAVPTPAALAALEQYPWPGNLREFAMVVTAAADKATGGVLDVPHLPLRLVRGTPGPSRTDLRKPPPLDRLLEDLERRMLRSAHAAFRGNKSKAAEHLGLSRARFLRRWEQLKMDEDRGGEAADEEEEFGPAGGE